MKKYLLLGCITPRIYISTARKEQKLPIGLHCGRELGAEKIPAPGLLLLSLGADPSERSNSALSLQVNCLVGPPPLHIIWLDQLYGLLLLSG